MKWFSNIRNVLITRSWRFWVVSGYVVIVAVFCSVWIWSLLGPLNEAVVDEQTKSLTAIVKIDALYLSETTQEVGVAAKNLVADTDLRATIIALDGTVLGDSSQNISTLENHLDRPEVQSALAGSVGSDARTSESDGVPRLYVAIPASYKGEDVIMRISEPMTDLTSIGTTMRNSGLILLGLGILTAALVAWRTYKSAARPVSRLEQVRSDFVAGASHELKTPVAGIRLLSDAITSASDDGDLETTKMFAARLDTEAQRLQHLVTDLLDLSRLESASRTDKKTQTDLHAAVSTSFEAHRAEAQRKGLKFVFQDMTTTKSNCYANMDASDASLVIDNLLDNAIRYTEKGSVTVFLGIEDGMVVVRVSDTGIGIPLVDQSRIFERFYRVDTARSREAGGTGLGLSLVRHAVKRGGGTIEVRSELGVGSIFTISIPQAF